ncbi:HlyD family secretion protein [Bradyrhizobium liaoningense]|uniref:HlyD family secretion protein n=1 Tax=Bradyrhizobium liaoningense TaxID=43992 RepID=UPI001BA50EE4|nr:HlyD family secretion protein [Bradyrhizobium liaoningense]MBR1167506.1 HlyD family secretion protein [Bradyrhizobium liaoningense]
MHGTIPAKVAKKQPIEWLKRISKQGAVVVGATLIATAASWYSWYWLTEGRFIESTDDAYVGGEVTTLASKVPGFVQTVAVTDNQKVKAGDLLIKLDDRDYRAQLDRTQASVDAQNATLANLDATVRLQDAAIEQARAEISATAAELERAKYDADRYRTLSDGQNASLQRYQQANADYKKALAADQRAHAGLEAAKRKLDVIETQKQQARAALGQAIAERDLARINLGDTEIRSPIDGVIGNRGARVGSYAITGAKLLSVVPTRGLWVDANFKENQLARIRQGQPVTIGVDLLPGATLRGRVVSLAPATGAQFSVIPPENATGNFTKIVQRVPVRIAIDLQDEAINLRPGLSAVVHVDERPHPDSPLARAKQ